ncbi:MAG: hypothetical protein L3K08_05060, partial [Thermoplasmata archaeon]|nr:hypothetical protein [Thermoplasmata archaeon]
MMIFRRHAPLTVGVLAVLGVLLLTGFVSAAAPGSQATGRTAFPVSSGSAVPSHSAPTTVLADDTTVLGGASGVDPIGDLVQPGIVGPTFRSYTIEVRVSAPQSGQSVLLETSPIVDWSSPSQLPGGPDALPPLAEWSWSVDSSGRSDSANWTVNPATQALESTVAWQNATYIVNGTFVGTETVTVSPGTRDGTTPTSLSVSLNGWSPGAGKSSSTTNLTAAAAALHPTIVRFGMTSSGIAASWNTTSGTPTFDFAHFDSVVRFISSLGA